MNYKNDDFDPLISYPPNNFCGAVWQETPLSFSQPGKNIENPVISMAGDGTAHLVAAVRKSRHQDLYYFRFTEYSSEAPIKIISLPKGTIQFCLAVNSSSNANVIFCFNGKLYYWSMNDKFHAPEQISPRQIKGIFLRDPYIALDTHDNLHISCIGHDPNQDTSTVYYCHKPAKAVFNWTEVDKPAKGTKCFSANIAIDPTGQVGIAYIKNLFNFPSDVYAVYGRNGRFTDPHNMSYNSDNFHIYSPKLAMAQGIAYISYLRTENISGYARKGGVARTGDLMSTFFDINTLQHKAFSLRIITDIASELIGTYFDQIRQCLEFYFLVKDKSGQLKCDSYQIQSLAVDPDTMAWLAPPAFIATGHNPSFTCDQKGKIFITFIRDNQIRLTRNQILMNKPMFIADIELETMNLRDFSQGILSVKIVDKSGNPVPDAWVFGKWFPVLPEYDRLKTDSSGIGKLDSPFFRPDHTNKLAFSVTDIQKKGFIYMPELNHLSSRTVFITKSDPIKTIYYGYEYTERKFIRDGAL